jgi:bacterioferritin
MQGDKQVIEQLNLALNAELTAIIQYMTQAEMCRGWGYQRIGDFTEGRAIEEMKHAEALIERIIFLEGMPSVATGLKPQFGTNVKEQMEINLKDEQDAVRQYNQASAICTEAADEGSRLLFNRLIQDEERHSDFLEAQVHAIKEMGIPNYLTHQMVGKEA